MAEELWGRRKVVEKTKHASTQCSRTSHLRRQEALIQDMQNNLTGIRCRCIHMFRSVHSINTKIQKTGAKFFQQRCMGRSVYFVARNVRVRHALLSNRIRLRAPSDSQMEHGRGYQAGSGRCVQVSPATTIGEECHGTRRRKPRLVLSTRAVCQHKEPCYHPGILTHGSGSVRG